MVFATSIWITCTPLASPFRGSLAAIVSTRSHLSYHPHRFPRTDTETKTMLSWPYIHLLINHSPVVLTVAALAAGFTFPLVVDPVMISKHGTRLMSAEAQSILISKLLRNCTLATPNISEAESLSGRQIETLEDAETAARHISDFGPKAVLVKGGHLQGAPVDMLWADGQIHHFPGTRIETRHTHGTGCTYSAAITALLANGLPLYEAISKAKSFIQAAIKTAPGLGRGCGPVNHFAG